MSSLYKRLLAFGISLLVLSAVLVSPSKAQAADTPLNGWAWSNNIGWVSFNSPGNPSAGGGPHSVVIDTSGNLVGWAWSSNIGWIKFGGLSGFPVASGNAKVSGSTITGWARACAGTISGDCSGMASRTDGWDGWIELTGVNHTVNYSNTSGTIAITGTAWGSEVVGWLGFNLSSTAVTGGSPSCTLTKDSPSLTGFTTLTWQSNTLMSSCTLSTNGVVSGLPTTSGTRQVNPSISTDYAVSCVPSTGGAAIPCLSPVNVTPSGPPDDSPSLTLKVHDDRYKDFTSYANSTGSYIATAKVRLGQPFNLLGGTNGDYSPYYITKSDTDPAHATAVDVSTILSGGNNIIQNVSIVTYTLQATLEDGTPVYVPIIVHAIDPTLIEI